MFYSDNRIPEVEALAAQNRLAALLSYKLKQEYSEICDFVRARMSLAIVRSNSLLLRGPRDKGAQVNPAVVRGTHRSLVPLFCGASHG